MRCTPSIEELAASHWDVLSRIGFHLLGLESPLIVTMNLHMWLNVAYHAATFE